MRSDEFVIEGVNDPAIFKVIFVVGGPGSGKSYISRQLGLGALGYTTVNSDVAFTYLMKKHDLDLKMPEIEKSKRDVVRTRAKEITGSKMELAIQGRLGLVIDGTGHDYEKVEKLKINFDMLGYNNFLVIVNTRLSIARQRNLTRSRSVPDEVVVKSWRDVQQNIGKFMRIFDNTAIIDNNGESDTSQQIDQTYTRLVKFTKETPSKSSATQWIRVQKQKNTIN